MAASTHARQTGTCVNRSHTRHAGVEISNSRWAVSTCKGLVSLHFLHMPTCPRAHPTFTFAVVFCFTLSFRSDSCLHMPLDQTTANPMVRWEWRMASAQVRPLYSKQATPRPAGHYILQSPPVKNLLRKSLFSVVSRRSTRAASTSLASSCRSGLQVPPWPTSSPPGPTTNYMVMHSPGKSCKQQPAAKIGCCCERTHLTHATALHFVSQANST